jgi:hypothetical protein
MDNIGDKTAFDLFPDIMGQSSTPTVEPPKKTPAPPAKKTPRKTVQVLKPTTAPPPPPDISWLQEGLFEDAADLDEASRIALVLIPDEQNRAHAAKALASLHYTIETAVTAAEAIEAVRTTPYTVIVYDTESEMSEFHNHICWLPPTKRRSIYYVIIGPNLHTLFNLEALTLSANLVVRDSDVLYLEKILGKGFQDYEELYNPFMEVLNGTLTSLF